MGEERQRRNDEIAQAKNGHLCPHKDAIQFCPLYVESHNARGLGCVDDMVRPCLVVRKKMDFDQGVERIRSVDPRLVAECEFGRDRHLSMTQRARNMRLAAVH